MKQVTFSLFNDGLVGHASGLQTTDLVARVVLNPFLTMSQHGAGLGKTANFFLFNQLINEIKICSGKLYIFAIQNEINSIKWNNTLISMTSYSIA